MIRKTAFAAAAAVALFGGVAVAQETTTPAEAPAAEAAPAAPAFATACPALPAAPPIPDGAASRERDMQAAEAAVLAWNTEYVNTMNTCRREELNAVEAEAQAAIAVARAAQARHQAAIARFNADSAVATNTGAAWMAQVDAFNAAQAAPRQRR